MAEARDIERVKLLTGETNENLIEAYLEEAADFVKSYTNRSVIITPLEKAVRDLAVIALNRMGTEGETSRSEGGENYSFETAPKQVYDIMNRYRLARTGGITFENAKKKDSEGSTSEEYGAASSISGESWPASGKVQAQQYGQRLNYIRNVRINGKYVSHPDDKGNVHFILEDGTDIQELDGIHLYTVKDQKPDYKIIAIKPYRFLTLEVERI